MCIEYYKVCDGTADCRDYSDELDCHCEGRDSMTSCPGPDVTCGRDCIPKQWLCDGHPDCPGGMDEVNCSTKSGESNNYNIRNKMDHLFHMFSSHVSIVDRYSL